MKLGVENKRQLAILGVLAVVLAYFFYANVLAPADEPPSTAPRQTAAARPNPIPGFGQQQAPEARTTRSSARNTRTGVQFKMSGADRNIDVTTIDPTLRLDLLAKVQAVTMDGGERNIFQFGAAPMPKIPEQKIIPAPAPVPAEVKPAVPVKPPPPPIPLKFYGYTQARPGVKRVFFLDGEDIIVAEEGELVKKRYRVVRIGINSVVVEDTQYENHQQTLALQEPMG